MSHTTYIDKNLRQIIIKATIYHRTPLADAEISPSGSPTLTEASGLNPFNFRSDRRSGSDAEVSFYETVGVHYRFITH
jgi:hypothetical protein